MLKQFLSKNNLISTSAAFLAHVLILATLLILNYKVQPKLEEYIEFSIDGGGGGNGGEGDQALTESSPLDNVVKDEDVIPEKIVHKKDDKKKSVTTNKPVLSGVDKKGGTSGTGSGTGTGTGTGTGSGSGSGSGNGSGIGTGNTTNILKVPETKKIEPPKESNVYYAAVEQMPEAIGGKSGISSRVYIPDGVEKISGVVYVKAYIDENGNVRNVKVLKGIGSTIDNAAANAVKRTKFTPGKKEGKPVKVQMTIDVYIK